METCESWYKSTQQISGVVLWYRSCQAWVVLEIIPHLNSPPRCWDATASASHRQKALCSEQHGPPVRATAGAGTTAAASASASSPSLPVPVDDG